MILPVLNCCAKDLHLARATLAASARLGKLNQTLLLCAPKQVDLTVLKSDALAAFTNVSLFRYDDWTGIRTWPAPQNHAWQQVARHLHAVHGSFGTDYSGWFWWEPDAVPLRANWLNALAASHEASGKTFSGHPVRTHLVTPYMNGVGIWPMKCIDALQNCTALYSTVQPFDIAAGPAVMSSFNDVSYLIVHERKTVGGGTGRAFNDTTLKGLMCDHPTAVLYHGCTDGSLHALVATGNVSAMIATQSDESDYLLPRQNVQLREDARWAVKQVESPKLRYIHCVERHIYPNQADNERVLTAFNSWVDIYKSGRMLPCHVWSYPRDSRVIGDKRALPYLKDILIEGMTKATQPHDVIVLTNDDTIFHADILHGLDQKLSLVDAAGSMRVNIKDSASLPALDTPREKIVHAGGADIGRDLIACKKSWLLANWSLIPDFLLGELEWDVVMAVLIRRSAALVTNRVNILQPAYECELPRGYVLHVLHDRAWTRSENLENPSKHYNRNLAHAWYKEHFPEMLIK